MSVGPTLRPCIRIEPERSEGIGVTVGLADKYGALEDELPLGGARSMRPDGDGGLHIIEQLRGAMPWMDDVLSLIERQLQVALWAGRPWIQFRPMCLIGPPGAGKSHLARELSRLSGVGHAALDLGAMSDSAALMAVSRGWTNTKPCWPAQMMASHRCANPVLTLDEVDKAGGSRRNGDPLTALLGMLENFTARSYFDTCLMCEVDLSAVCWICTANDASRIPPALASRLEIVEVTPPAVEHFETILGDILAALALEWAVPSSFMPELPRNASAVLRDGFARHRSVRLLRRHVEDVVAALVRGPREGCH